MALPILETPKYETKIPSTGKKIHYRPYLVKEEKILMVAMESSDQKQMLQAMKDVVASCTFDKVDPDKLALFDLEYLFLKLRAKSVGETSKLSIKCEKCEKKTNVDVHLDSIEVDMSHAPSNKIKLTDKVGISLTWPKVDFLTTLGSKTEEDQRKALFDIVIKCIDSIYDEKQIHKAADQTPEELLVFVESLNQSQFQKIQEFIEKMPKLEHEIVFNCAHCKQENKVMIRGLQNFF